DNLLSIRLVGGPLRQRQSVAETAFGAAGVRRLIVESVSGLEIAQKVRAARQHVSERGLSLRRAGLRRAPGPFQRGIEIGAPRLVHFEQAAPVAPFFIVGDVDKAVDAE